MAAAAAGGSIMSTEAREGAAARLSEQQVAEIRQVFSICDQDGDGAISAKASSRRRRSAR
jgi:Ca2+-binding EF-hand superfamily protein